MEAPPPTYTQVDAPSAVPAPDALPGYSDSNAPPSGVFIPSPGIDDKLPNHFKVDDQYVKAQVLPSDLEAHLVLLSAFHRLREEVRTFKGKADIPMEPDDRYAVFLQRAVYRFEQWAVRMIGGEGQEEEELGGGAPRILASNEVPPLDVMMVWHTYMLNPRTYYEDCIRKLPGLLRIGSFPLRQLVGSIDRDTLLPHPPSESRVAAWGSFTEQPFDPPTNTTSEDMVLIFCPSCSQPNTIPWITYKGDGYAQRGFSCACSSCQFSFSRETLGVRKFYADMEKCLENSDKYFMANTVVDYQSGVPVEKKWSKALSVIVIGNHQGTLKPARPEHWAKQIGWSMKNVEDYCRIWIMHWQNKPYISTPRSLNIILSAYCQPGPFSLDLASAVIRQMNFVDKMVHLGFTESGRWEDDQDTLTRCVVRYHHFLDLMVTTAGKFAVPTLDIDLAWHTHQLLCDSYRKLKDVIGVVPDHDDKVSQGALSDAYDKTAEAWKARFGVPYSVCGCLPPTKSMEIPGSDSRGGFSLFSKKGKSKAEPAKPFENTRPDLVSAADDAAEQTHPSDHDAVAIINPGEQNKAQAQLRRKELGKREKELGKSIEKGRADKWAEVVQKRVADHPPSFLCPVQYGVQHPFGKYGHGDCTSLSGAGVKGNFAAGECCKGNGTQGLCGAQVDRARGGPIDSVAYAATMSGNPSYVKSLGITELDGAGGQMLASAAWGMPTSMSF